MSETHHDVQVANDGRPHDPEDFDREIDLRGVVWTAVGITITTILSGLAMLLLLRLFDHMDTKAAEPRPPMAEAKQVAPEPALQPAPRRDMDDMKAREDHDLEHASWIDQNAGTVKLPISVAMDMAVAQGLAGGQATGQSTSMDRGPTNQASMGTVLPAPGQGVGQLGPSAAAPISQSGQTPVATDASRGAPVPMPANGASGTGTPAGPGGHSPLETR
jgi:hypothetical protein